MCRPEGRLKIISEFFTFNLKNKMKTSRSAMGNLKPPQAGCACRVVLIGPRGPGKGSLNQAHREMHKYSSRLGLAN